MNQRDLDLQEFGLDPYLLFNRWLQDAVAANLVEPTAFTLSTMSLESMPASRVVLFKGFQGEAFQFFTNYQSRKGREIINTPYVAMVFYWASLQKQIRIEGYAEKSSADDSDRYFATRARESQLGAWASAQSSVLGSREELGAQMEQFRKKFVDQPVPRPPHWGGFDVTPRQIEFWHGQKNRLHDRCLFTRDGGHWNRQRLSP